MKKLFFIGFLLLLISYGCLAQIPTVGLNGYWPFSGYQFANDFSGNSNNGIINGASLTTDRFGNCEQAYKFNGINNFIEVPNSPTVDMNNTDFTLAFWLKTYITDVDGNAICKNLLGNWSGYEFVTNNTNPGYCTTAKHAYFYVAAGANQDVCTDSSICSDTTWHFITGIYKYAANTSYLYVDGILQSTVGAASGSSSNNQNLCFGSHSLGTLGFFKGVLDAIRIYSRALSSLEIAQLYNEVNPGSGCNTVLCTTLDAPIFNEDFGSGASLFGPALPTGVTTYTYVTISPMDGYYTISNNGDPTNYGNFIKAGDHTGNPNGYMMIVNSSFAAGEVYRKHVTNLCPNTTYVFSSWIANNDIPSIPTNYCAGSFIYPNIKIQAEYPVGTIQDSQLTGNIPIGTSNTSYNWQQYSFSFTTLTGQTSVDLVMINNAPGGCGNDYVVDDISIAPCGAGNLITVTGNTLICSGVTATLTANGASSYTWSANAASANTASIVVSPTVTTTYTIMANSGTCGSQMAVATVSVTNLSVSISGDTTICIGQSTLLTASGASTYTWNTGSTMASIVVSPSSTATYSVKGGIGTCTAQANVNLSVNTSFDVIMPNIVTPNNDGTNDFVDFGKYQFSSIQLDIFDRWGIKIFESNNPACVWKPTEDDGTYFYIIQYAINCNNEKQNKTLKGFITVIR
jgi:gliding motility-associated-like protein